MRISIRHETRYDYAEPAAGVVMRLRMKPASSSAQTVERWIANGYGDGEAVWRAGSRVEGVTIVAEGDVRTFDVAGVLRLADGAPRPQLFLRTTPLTQADAGIVALAERGRSTRGPLSSLHTLKDIITEEVVWRAGITTSATTAAEAFALKAGVCQDQSQIFIAAARCLGIPARYVTGYLEDPERPDDEHASHAWAEAFVEGLGWIGFDCTLGRCPIDGHVRLACGLDAADAAPIRGVMLPAGETKLSHDVQIAALPLDGPAQAQTQQ